MKTPKAGTTKPPDCTEGVKAAKQFTSLVRRVIKTPKAEVDRRTKEWKEARAATPKKG